MVCLVRVVCFFGVFLAIGSCKIHRGNSEALDVGVAVDGEVFLLYKEGRNVVVKQCKDNTILCPKESRKKKASNGECTLTDFQIRERCQLKPNTKIARPKLSLFRSHLKSILYLPAPASHERFSDLKHFTEKNDRRIYSASKKEIHFKKRIDELKSFIDAQPARKSNERLSRNLKILQDELKSAREIGQKNVTVTKAVLQINKEIDNFIDGHIEGPKNTLYEIDSDKDRSSILFYILKSYLRDVKVSNWLRFVKIPAGEVLYGDHTGKGLERERPTVKIKIEGGWEMAATETTQGLWFRIMGNWPSYFRRKGDCPSKFRRDVSGKGNFICETNPVESVSRKQIQVFIKKLNDLEDGYKYYLPTEAFWEYTARAGKSGSIYSFGDDPKELNHYAWWFKNSGARTHPVASTPCARDRRKPCHPWGLFDIHGNVFEMVRDQYDKEFYKYIKPDKPNLHHNEYQTDGRPVIRGPGWWDQENASEENSRFRMRVSYRSSVPNETYSDSDDGFRLMRKRKF